MYLYIHIYTVVLLRKDVSQSVPRPAASPSPGNWLETQILSPAPDLLIQKLWGKGSPVWVSTSPLGDSDAH